MQRKEREWTRLEQLGLDTLSNFTTKTFSLLFSAQERKKAHHEGFSTDAPLRVVLGRLRECESPRGRVRRVSRELLSQGTCLLLFIITRAWCYNVFDARWWRRWCFPVVVGGVLLTFYCALFLWSTHHLNELSLISHQQHVSTPTFMPSDVNVCREYQHEACCSLDTVRKYV